MSTDNFNSILKAQLQKAYARDNKAQRRSIKITTAIKFSESGQKIRMDMSSSCVEANMQNDKAAFEGWALTIKRWLGRDVELCWEQAGIGAPRHYQRFLYRVAKFNSLFPRWFSICRSIASELQNLETEDKGHDIVVNKPRKERLPKDPSCDHISNALVSENDLECFIVHNTPHLKKRLGLDHLARQLPVGVFRDEAKRRNAIFPGGHAQIDIWGVSKSDRKFFLFELKKPGNEPMGALSEMFFYSFVIEDVQRKRFRMPNPDVIETDSIETYLLAPTWHPLIDGEMIKTVNQAFKDKDHRILFGAIEIATDNTNGDPFRLAIPCEIAPST